MERIQPTNTFIHLTKSQWAQGTKLVGKCESYGLKGLQYIVLGYKMSTMFPLRTMYVRLTMDKVVQWNTKTKLHKKRILYLWLLFKTQIQIKIYTSNGHLTLPSLGDAIKENTPYKHDVTC